MSFFLVVYTLLYKRVAGAVGESVNWRCLDIVPMNGLLVALLGDSSVIIPYYLCTRANNGRRSPADNDENDGDDDTDGENNTNDDDDADRQGGHRD
jgi:hypothetical protein